MVFALISLGCPKNQVDADVMCRRLLAAGHTTTADLSEADMILVNTCGFIDSAKSEAIENILMACEYKKNNPAVKVVVTGCLAQRYQSQIADEIPEVDGVVGLGSSEAIVAILERIAGGEKVESYGPKTALPLGGERVVSTPRHYAYLKIAEGCNNCCHYCAIPSIRGPLRSRTVEDCVAEARWLAAQGVKELILVAQDVTAFGDDRGENEICRLLDELQPVEGIEWIRMLYAYPERITDEFIAAMVRNGKVLHYIDIPVQHSVTRVLKSMNRKGDEETIRSAVSRLRAAMPDITLRTTLIAGYPGETEEEFAQLQQFVREMKFDRLGCFAYSQEEGTVAAKMENQLDEDTKQQRADSIMRIQTGVMAEKQAAMVGRTLKVLCDGLDEESGLYLCRSAGDAPDIDGAVCVRSEEPLYPGEFYTVLVEESDEYDLFAVPVNEEEKEMNLPNKLTLLRILLIPVFVALVEIDFAGHYLWAVAVFAIASFTDYLDGHLARKWGLVTDFGKFADPLADKILTTTAIIYLVQMGLCHPVVLIIIIAREFAVSGVRMIAAGAPGGKVIAANMWGKVKTVLQMVSIIVVFVLLGLGVPATALVAHILMWAVGAATLISGVQYLWGNRQYINTAK